MKVLFFVQVRSFAGCDQLDLEVEHAIDAQQLWAELERRIPGIRQFESSTRLARNSEYAAAGQLFGNGDEVALLAPVSGG